jgi:hypothetical protein
MNDSTIRLIGEVLLLWGVGVVDVLWLGGGGGGWGWYDLYLLVVLVCVMRWMRSGAVDVWRRGLLICVRDNPRVVGWLRRAILSLVAFVSGQSLVGWAQSSPWNRQ